MNWGLRIILLYTGFVSFMLFLVYQCMQQDIDLVTENYYAKELAYKDQYVRMQNSLDPQMRLAIDFDPQSKVVTIAFPGELNEKPTGEIQFFRPDNKTLDFKVPVQSDAENIQHISCSELTRGLWKMQISWNAGETGMYETKNVFVP